MIVSMGSFPGVALLDAFCGTVANLAWESSFAELVQFPLQVAIFEAVEDRP